MATTLIPNINHPSFSAVKRLSNSQDNLIKTIMSFDAKRTAFGISGIYGVRAQSARTPVDPLTDSR